MKININGVIRDMTDLEIAEMEKDAAQMSDSESRTEVDVRLDEIEAALIELAAMLGGA